MKLKNSSFYVTQTQMVKKLKNSNCDTTQIVTKLKKNQKS